MRWRIRCAIPVREFRIRIRIRACLTSPSPRTQLIAARWLVPTRPTSCPSGQRIRCSSRLAGLRALLLRAPGLIGRDDLTPIQDHAGNRTDTSLIVAGLRARRAWTPGLSIRRALSNRRAIPERSSTGPDPRSALASPRPVGRVAGRGWPARLWRPFGASRQDRLGC
jgi:hypothetical protein